MSYIETVKIIIKKPPVSFQFHLDLTMRGNL